MATTPDPSPVVRVPGPQFEAKLSSFDCRHGSFFSRRLLIFKCSTSPNQLTAILHRALELLVHKFPFLAGQVKPAQAPGPTGQSGWKDLVPGPGLLLTTRDLTSELTFSDLAKSSFSPERLEHDLLIPLPLKTDPESYDTAHFRLNFIDGGLMLAVCIAHLVADGVAQSEILRHLASYCKLVSHDASVALSVAGEPLGLDRSCLLGLSSPLNGPEHHPAMAQKHPGLVLKTEDHLPAELIRVYRFPPERLQKLKQDASSSLRISTNDALTALVWRGVLKSRVAAGAVDPERNGEVSLYFPVSLRRKLGLGDSYIGNAVCNRLVRQPLSDLLGPLPGSLQRTAALIRSEINRVDGDIARGYAQLSDSAPSVTDFVFSGFSTIKSTSIAINSLYHFNEGLTREDWGDALGGRLVKLRSSDLGFAAILGGINFILPEGNGGADVQVSCCRGGVDALEGDEAWRMYCALE